MSNSGKSPGFSRAGVVKYHVHLNVRYCEIDAAVTVTLEAVSDDVAQAFAYALLGDCETCDVAEIEEAE